jgi:hypothetical protein
MGDVTIRVTNTLDQDANDESIGYGDMSLDYDYDPTVEWPETVYPTASPANYDEGHNNPTSLWNNDCSATEKSCGGFNYFGGYNECAQGHRFWRTFYQDVMHPNTNRVTFSGRIWTIDSWDGEQFTIQMTDQDGNVMDTRSFTGNNFANQADQTLQCEGSVGGWQDGWFSVELSAPYDASKGDVTITVTNTLDQGAGDESIGYGDMLFNYEFDDGTPSNIGNPDDGVANPDLLWENNCNAQPNTCNGLPGVTFMGGFNQCGKGHDIWRHFRASEMHPGMNRVRFSGKIWTINSWDNEQFTVSIIDQNNNVLDTVTKTGNNFNNNGDENFNCDTNSWPQSGWF